MFGKNKKQPTVTTNLTPTDVAEVSHTFDQTNGVLKAFDDYQNNHPNRAADTTLRNQTVTGIAMLTANRPAG